MKNPHETRRNSAHRVTVSAALIHSPGFVSASELHHSLNANGSGIGLATVYRQLNALTEDGLADVVTSPSGQLFRACTPTHHHHLVCESCGAAIEVSPPVEKWLATVAAEHGFTVNSHVFEVFGTCAACSAA